MAAAVVNRFPPDPAEPRLGKQFPCYAAVLTVLGLEGFRYDSIFRDVLLGHDPANECLVTGLSRIAACKN
jgi:hypothetical protein